MVLVVLMALTMVSACQKKQEEPVEVNEPTTQEEPKPVLGGWTVNNEVITTVVTDEAQQAFEKSANSRVRGNSDLSYYQVKALRKLGKTAEADAALKQMVTMRDNMQKNLVDNYAKFGESNRNVQESNMNYFSGLVEDLQGNEAAAKQAFSKASSLNPGNIWAKWMNKEKAF